MELNELQKQNGFGIKRLKDKLPNSRELGLILFILVASVFIQTQNSSFLTMVNLTDMLTNTSILAILAVGMMMVLITGGIDLSVGAVVALSGMSSAVFIRDFPNIPVIVAVLVGLFVGLFSGLVLGLLIAKGRILPIIASLGMMNVYRGLTYIVGDNQWVSAFQMTDAFKEIATGSFLGINHLIWAAFIVLAVVYYILNFTRSGRRMYAVGSNEEATAITGISKERTLILVYMLNGLLAGLAGVLWVSKFASAQGDTASGYELNVIAACVLGGVSVNGGVGKISGLITGALLFGILNNALPLLNASTFWEDAIQGVVIVAAIVMNVLMKRRSDAAALKRREL
ncbi:ABC transporter permease [Enterococcus casseliflavus]|uniref:ABC transporter permease n=1 Tax=Enterococcus casseliflavus TaxID=37734 RepID=UPI001AD7851F|nr:ABC transporter permease [Enterococcus casseliflavus]MBO6348854.1 ABC transporter permease [Enterococcus casseliflavus]MBO6368054.1 ABC transporter permease [Enterococcus casseliflavus]